MKKFLVISYTDEDYTSQFFYDHVYARDEDAAVKRIQKIRPYVNDSNAIGVGELTTMVNELASATPQEIKRYLAEID